MKKKIIGAILGILTIAISHDAVQAAGLSGFGETYLGFDTTTGTGAYKNVVFDIGTYSQDISGVLNLDQSSGSSLLSTIYGSNWATRSDITWFAFSIGSNNAVSGLTLGVSAGNPALNNGNINGYSTSQKNTFQQGFSAIQSEANNVNYNTLGSVNGTLAASVFAIGTSADSTVPTQFVSGSWGDQIDSGSSGISAAFGSLGQSYYDGFTRAGLDIYNYTGSGSSLVAGDAAAYTLYISSSGVISSTVNVVPEPSTYALIALGGLMAIAVRKKFRKA